MPREDIHDSEVYDKLVKDADDVEGLVAYARYKASERTWIKNHLKRHGAPPTDEDFADYVSTHDDPSIQRLRTEAQSMLVSFAYEIVENERPEIGEQAVSRAIGNHFQAHETGSLTRHNEVIGRIVAAGSFKRELVKAFVGAFVVNIVTLVLIFLFLAPNPVDTFIYLFRHAPIMERVAPTHDLPGTDVPTQR